MPTIKVRLKTEEREAWQYNGITHAPPWVKIEYSEDYKSPFLIRRSGKQLINLTDWIIRDLDGEPEWLTNDEMIKKYERIN